MKKLASLLFHRTALVALLLLLQVGLLAVIMLRFSNYFIYFYWFCVLISVAAVLWIVSANIDPGYKIAWLIPILLAPFFGGLAYLLVSSDRVSHRARKKMMGMDAQMHKSLVPDFKSELLADVGPDAVNQSRYMEQYAHSPLYQNTLTEYFPLGDDAFPRMLEELRAAENYIFLEYFIIKPGEMWDAILAILEEKVKAGLDVRVLYDDLGCLYTLPTHYEQTLAKKGIKAHAFHRFVPVLSTHLNNRDHRKFCIIDGRTAFTGGINLSDEYINRNYRLGHWKDSVILLQGEAVWSIVVMFLTLWDYALGGDENFNDFRPAALPEAVYAAKGWVQPYADSPLDEEEVASTVYLNLISKAKRSVYLTTPYLILSDRMTNALCMAAKAGVDVRIITPHNPDKKLVFEVTRAHYLPLLEAGVRIFEYTPGFMHAKNFVVDDLYATVGSVNMDYRSLSLHFEAGVWLCAQDAVTDVKEDFLRTQEISMEVTLEQSRSQPFFRRLVRSVLRVFAPLM